MIRYVYTNTCRFPNKFAMVHVCVCGAVHRCVICVSAVMEICLCFRKQDSREHPCMYKQIHLDISKVHQTNISCIMLIYAC